MHALHQVNHALQVTVQSFQLKLYFLNSVFGEYEFLLHALQVIFTDHGTKGEVNGVGGNTFGGFASLLSDLSDLCANHPVYC